MINQFYGFCIIIFLVILGYLLKDYISIEEFDDYPIENFVNKNIEINTNLIDNGNFPGGKVPRTTRNSAGNSIIKLLPNPGSGGSYVLKQTAFIKNKTINTSYDLNIDIKAGIDYKISCWVAYTPDWNGNKLLFTLEMGKRDGTNLIMKREGKLMKTKLLKNLVWEYRSFSFKTPTNLELDIEEKQTGKLLIKLGENPDNTNGFRYFTNIELIRDYPLIPGLPIAKNLVGFLTTHLISSISERSQYWKDLSMEGNDMKFNKNIDSCLSERKINLTNSHAIIQKSKRIISDIDNFSILWTGEFSEHNKGVLLRMEYPSVGFILEIVFENNYGADNLIHIRLDNKNSQYNITYEIYTYVVGITQNYTQYCFVRTPKDFYLYIDGFEIRPTKKSNPQYNSNTEYIDGLYKNINKAKLSVTPGDEETTVETFTNKEDIYKIEINPLKKVHGKIETICLYNKSLETPEIVELNHYIKYIKHDKNINFDRPDISKRDMENIIPAITNTVTKNDVYVCPFNISEESPCNSDQCTEDDLNANSANISNQCKKIVQDYCSVTKEPGCSSSQKILDILSEKEDNAENDGKSSDNEVNDEYEKNEGGNIPDSSAPAACDMPDLSNYIKIDELPDEINNRYIRKDKIPCWGCKLD